MHTLIIGLWRNLGQTLPEVDDKLAERETALAAELNQVREARQLIAATMSAARIERPQRVEHDEMAAAA